MSYLQSAASREPQNAARREAASTIIRAFNEELNHYNQVLLPAYNERVSAWNLQMHLYKIECIRARNEYA